MNVMKKLVQIWWQFFLLGLMTFGGGIAMLPSIKRKAIHYQWIQETDWEEMVSLAQLAPGAIAVNAANLIGYKACGILGSIAAVFGMMTSPIAVITTLAWGLQSWLDHPVVTRALEGMFVVVFVLFTYAVIGLGKIAIKQWWMILISFVTFIVVYLGWLPSWLLLLMTMLLILSYYGSQRKKS